MPMNLVILPLEGVSQTIFWNYRTSMPTLWRLSEQAIMFRRFYSNSTSALSSFCDFMHGDSSELDHNLRYPTAGGCLAGAARNFFDVLDSQGYATLGMQHGGGRPEYLRDNVLGIWPDNCGEFRWHGEYDPFFSESFQFIEAAKRAGKPFALYLNDRAATVADDCREKRDAQLFHERFAKGYSLLDGTVAKVMEKLQSLSLLDNTIVCAFGPYGMDPWKHGIYGGRTHAADPYADVSWTPMFLYNNDRDAKTVDALASVIDIKATLLGVLFPGQTLDKGRGVFSGVNLMELARSVVFTQNLFALERENEGPARGIAKSYAATDGDQRLIVTSDGGIAGEGGMELYYDPRDSTSGRNLLDFFAMDDKGVLTSFGRNDATHPHFLYAFHPDRPQTLIKSVVDSYNAMRDVLQMLVRTKEEEALGRCPTPKEAKRFKESSFTIKRKRS